MTSIEGKEGSSKRSRGTEKIWNVQLLYPVGIWPYIVLVAGKLFSRLRYVCLDVGVDPPSFSKLKVKIVDSRKPS